MVGRDWFVFLGAAVLVLSACGKTRVGGPSFEDPVQSGAAGDSPVTVVGGGEQGGTATAGADGSNGSSGDGAAAAACRPSAPRRETPIRRFSPG